VKSVCQSWSGAVVLSLNSSAAYGPQRLRSPVVTLSLGGLRRRIEIALLPDNVRIVLQLDGLAERERPPPPDEDECYCPMSIIAVASKLYQWSARCRRRAVAVAGGSAGGPASAILTASRPS
jgi:hypothetical protein